MINYNKNKLINKALEQYYNTFSRTLDTADFVPTKFNDKISKYIYKNMKKALKKIDKEDRIFQKQLLNDERKQKKLELKKQKQQRAIEKPKSKLAIFFKMLFARKKDSKNTKKELMNKQSEDKTKIKNIAKTKKKKT